MSASRTCLGIGIIALMASCASPSTKGTDAPNRHESASSLRWPGFSEALAMSPKPPAKLPVRMVVRSDIATPPPPPGYTTFPVAWTPCGTNPPYYALFWGSNFTQLKTNIVALVTNDTSAMITVPKLALNQAGFLNLEAVLSPLGPFTNNPTP